VCRYVCVCMRGGGEVNNDLSDLLHIFPKFLLEIIDSMSNSRFALKHCASLIFSSVTLVQNSKFIFETYFRTDVKQSSK